MMKKIYIEKIRQAFRFGLIDEDGRKTPCGTLWSDAQRETFERLMNGGNNLAFMAWDSNGGKKSALWAKWTDARGAGKTLQTWDVRSERADGRVCRSRTRNSRRQQMLRNVRTLLPCQQELWHERMYAHKQRQVLHF